MTDVPSRNRSGVRGEGDDYQHLVTLNEALRAIRGNGVRAVTVEADGAGNVDDIVLHDAVGPRQFTQVKHAVDAKTPVSTDYLLKPVRKDRASLMQRFRDSWRLLGANGQAPKLRLVTDRDIDPNDIVFQVLDRRTGRLMPDFGRRSLKSARAAWLEHLEMEEEELLQLMETLHFESGRSMGAERELVQVQLAARGLNHDQGAVDSCMAFVREWVQQRDRTMTVEEIELALTERVGREADPRGLLVIEAIGEAPAADEADVHLRFVELYDGNDSYSRTTLHTPDDWQNVVWPELEAAANTLLGRGLRDVVVGGPMRLPMWFGTGCALRAVEGFQVAMNQNGQIWSSEDIGTLPAIGSEVVALDGDDPRLAVVVSVAVDASELALSHVGSLGVGTALLLTPTGGARGGAVPDGATANALAESFRNRVRDVLEPRTTEVHLFLAAPAGLSLLLGHKWNRIRPTTVYEHTPDGYVSTFTVPA